LTILGSIAGALVVTFGFLFANGAPQEAAAAGLGLSMAVIPYCMAKAYSEMNN
jgi:hypothetical protein